MNMINISKKITDEKKGYLDLKFCVRRKINKVNTYPLSFRTVLSETWIEQIVIIIVKVKVVLIVFKMIVMGITKKVIIVIKNSRRISRNSLMQNEYDL